MENFKFIIYEDREANFFVPPHYHDYYELVYYYDCSGEYFSQKIDDLRSEEDYFLKSYSGPGFTHPDCIEFKDRTIILTPPYTVHSEKHKKKGKILAFGFLPDPRVSLPENFAADSSAQLHAFLSDILTEFKEKKSNWQIALDNLLGLLCIELSRHKKPIQSANTLLYVKNFIDNYYMTNITTARLAAMASFSENHFINLFTREFGITPKAYISEIRLKKASDLLTHTNMSITEIASRVGYKDISQFSAFYKKKIGHSPRQEQRNIPQK